MREQCKNYDAVIIGAGPAGVSCAVWLARLGFSPVLLEASEQVGGLCRFNPFHDDWNVSLPGKVGSDVANNLALSLEQAGVPVKLSHAVKRVEATAQGFAIGSCGSGDTLHANYIVLATGVTARMLPGHSASACQASDGAVPRGAPATGSSVLIGPGPHVVAQDFQHKRVAVLGGGDNAFENALYALRHGAQSVQIYARSIRAQQQFVRQVPASQVALGDYRADAQASTVNGVHYDIIMVFYGWEPSVRFADGLKLERTARGYIATDAANAQTSCPGVYAIGEVAQRLHPCVVTAMADGITAAKAIQAEIESSR